MAESGAVLLGFSLIRTNPDSTRLAQPTPQTNVKLCILENQNNDVFYSTGYKM